ncbi:MAG: hypothetical protein HFI09_01020, partial [Bacilli bacterium]|nr:hypothetical protein [Bacilli bacterium]
MKIKFALLILVLILCSGCSVDYTLQIDERNVFYEKFQLVTENNEESKQLQEDPFPYKAFYDDPDSGDYPEKLDGVSYYATEILNNGRFYTKQFEFEFLDYQISRANSIHTCYEKVNVNENEIDGTFTLQTSSKFLCMDNFPSLN